MKTTDFVATLPQSLTLTASLQYQAIHTGQSLSGPFWNGLVPSAKKYLSLTSSFSETQPGHWRLTPHAHGATTHRLNCRTWPKISPFKKKNLWTLKLCRHSCVSQKEKKANPDTPSMRKNLCWSEPPTRRGNTVSEHDHFPSQMLGGPESMDFLPLCPTHFPNHPKHRDFSPHSPLLSHWA